MLDFHVRFEMIEVVMEAQERFEAQIELQRLRAAGQFFAPVSDQEGFNHATSVDYSSNAEESVLFSRPCKTRCAMLPPA